MGEKRFLQERLLIDWERSVSQFSQNGEIRGERVPQEFIQVFLGQTQFGPDLVQFVLGFEGFDMEFDRLQFSGLSQFNPFYDQLVGFFERIQVFSGEFFFIFEQEDLVEQSFYLKGDFDLGKMVKMFGGLPLIFEHLDTVVSFERIFQVLAEREAIRVSFSRGVVEFPLTRLVCKLRIGQALGGLECGKPVEVCQMAEASGLRALRIHQQ
ncbi:hypothetical protein ES703_85896 [subsurface metagenome]